MAEPPLSCLLAQPFTMVAADVTVTDSGAGSPRTASFAADRVCRMFLADRSGSPAGVNSGTDADPDEWIGVLEWVLNDNGALLLWTCELTAAGRIKITYNGTGTGQIKWDGLGGTSLIPRYLAGFDANVSLSAGASVTATHPPTHTVFCIAGRANADGWNTLPRRSAVGETDDGRAYAFTATRARRVYASDWRFFPYDTTAATALGSSATPYQPDATARWTVNSATPATSNSPPWSVTDFLATAHGARCGVALGNLQALVAGTDSAFFDVTLARETLQAPRPFAPSSANWSQRVDWKNVVLRYVAHGTR